MIGGRGGWFGESFRHYLASKGVKTKVDLRRYAGEWRQESVKNEPWFQRGCKDVRARYSLNKDGSVRVVNSCDGREVEGVARSVSDDNRRLKVSFGFPFGEGDYRIKSVDDDYSRAVVRSGDTEWVLVRPKRRFMLTKKHVQNLTKRKDDALKRSHEVSAIVQDGRGVSDGFIYYGDVREIRGIGHGKYRDVVVREKE